MPPPRKRLRVSSASAAGSSSEDELALGSSTAAAAGPSTPRASTSAAAAATASSSTSSTRRRRVFVVPSSVSPEPLALEVQRQARQDAAAPRRAEAQVALAATSSTRLDARLTVDNTTAADETAATPAAEELASELGEASALPHSSPLAPQHRATTSPRSPSPPPPPPAATACDASSPRSVATVLLPTSPAYASQRARSLSRASSPPSRAQHSSPVVFHSAINDEEQSAMASPLSSSVVSAAEAASSSPYIPRQPINLASSPVVVASTSAAIFTETQPPLPPPRAMDLERSLSPPSSSLQSLRLRSPSARPARVSSPPPPQRRAPANATASSSAPRQARRRTSTSNTSSSDSDVVMQDRPRPRDRSPAAPPQRKRSVSRASLSSSSDANESEGELEIPREVLEMIQQEEAAAAAAGGRALRKRTAAQLNPYSMEQAAYARTLNKNGWEDAVLRLKALEARRQREREEQEERERRDVSAAARASGEADASDAESRRKKDDLGGWLRYSSSSTSSDEGIGSSDLSSIDHSDSDEVLPRQRVRHNKDALFVDEDGDGADDEGNDWDKGMPDDFDWRAPPTRVAPQGSTTTAKPSGSKKARNKKRAGGIKRVQGHGFAVAGSQDPYYDDGRPRAGSRSIRGGKKRRRPHTGLVSALPRRPEEAERARGVDPLGHRFQQRHLSDDEDRLEGLLERGVQAAKSKGKERADAQPRRSLLEDVLTSEAESGGELNSMDEQESESELDAEEEARAKQERLEALNTKLSGKRSRALRAMMPAAFFKKAKRDLELMEQERSKGVLTLGSSDNSGDEDERRKERRASRGRSMPREGGRAAPAGESDEDISAWLEHYDEPRKKKKDKRRPFEVRRDSRSPKRASKASRPKRVPLQTVSMNGEGAVFNFAGFSKVWDAPLPESPVRAPPRVTATDQTVPAAARAPVLPLRQQKHSAAERWATVRDFSYDFQIQRLAFGIQLPPQSLPASGHLLSLLRTATTPTTRFCRACGLDLRSTQTSQEIEALLPQISDAIWHKMTDPSIEEGDGGLAQLMRFLGRYLDEPEGPHGNLPAMLCSHLEKLHARLDDEAIVQAKESAFHRDHLRMLWYFLDLSIRAKDTELAEACLSSLVRKLLAQGIEHTTKSLKSLASAADAGVLRDDAAELWICLIQLAISDEPRTALLDERRFWTLVMDTVIDKVPAAARHSPIAGEACAYTAMTLCALSQFAPSGLCGATPRLKAHWPVMLRALEAIDLGELRQSELEGLSDTALARRDRYLHTLFARTIVLAQRWGWRITVNDAIVPKLFAVLNARELADLSIEMRDDFPPFLRTFNGQIADLAFNPSADTVFDVYCKLLFTAVEGVTDSRALTRFLLRVCPSQVNSWTRQTGRGASTLVNHLSLFAISVFLLPSSARQRIAQATQLVPFEKASDTAKRIQLRSAMYFLLMLKWHGVDSQPVIQWLVSVSNRLKATYCQALADRKSKKEGAKPYGAAGDLLKPSARLLALLLDSVRFVATWQRPEQSRPAAPDLHLLHDAWISSLLDSPLATDPLVAVQVASFVESFLQTRDAALAPSRAPTNSESQDEFGVFDDFDYADPALNAMLGVEPDAALSEGKALADILKRRVGPAIFRALTACFGHVGDAVPAIVDRADYAERLVRCWVHALQVVVEHSLSDWTPFLRYGETCWKRISDPVGRREIGLRFLVHLLERDPRTYGRYEDEYLDLWCQTILAPAPTVQHKYQRLLLQVTRPSTLFTGIGETSSELLFLERRPTIIDTVLKRMSEMMAAPSVAGNLGAGVLVNLMRSMLEATKDYLANIRERDQRRSYARFVQPVIAATKSTGQLAARTTSELTSLESLVTASLQ